MSGFRYWSKRWPLECYRDNPDPLLRSPESCRRTGCDLWRRLKGDAGGVLMEYVLVTGFIVLPLMIVGLAMANPTGKPTFVLLPGEGESYGFLGQYLVNACRELMSGVALPLP